MNCFWRLSSTAISDADEGRYGVAASEMLRSHSLLVATYAGRPEYWNLKPPLGYWMQELAYVGFGPTVFALRLPSALCAMALIALTLWVCQRWYGRRHALLAGLILTCCFGFIAHHGARNGDLDSALSLIVLGTVIQIPRLAQSARSRLLWAGLLALGFLLKSFAVLPVVLFTALYLAWSGDWRRSRWRDWLPALALLAGIIGAWVLARYRVDGSMYFVDRMMREDLLQRSTQVIDPGTSKPWGYLEVLLDRFAPWPLFILAAALLRKRWHAPQRCASRLVLLWALVPLVTFSLARTHHHWYLDPSYPAWSILAAGALLELLALSAGGRRVALSSLLVLAVLFCEGRILIRIGLKDRRPPNQVFLMSLQDHALIPASQTIEVAFPLSYSERFILEVVDGYHLVAGDQRRTVPTASIPPAVAMPPAVTAPPAVSAPHGSSVLLLRRRQLEGVPADRFGSAVLVANGSYFVLKGIDLNSLGAAQRLAPVP
ncbi:MAG TPA: glycosyltransferase family 39 protein [Steroidobacteraceae bacterium]|jgi:4-amino-4-deoxy-L-arabinose transferase-like glycosyltransferase|nr:glycosyltransferase family 39 protein [Steroidobacteraceae bacterium]